MGCFICIDVGHGRFQLEHRVVVHFVWLIVFTILNEFAKYGVEKHDQYYISG